MTTMTTRTDSKKAYADQSKIGDMKFHRTDPEAD